MPTQPSWQSLPLSSPLYASPGAKASAPVGPKLQVLPFHQVSWEDFERLLLRVLRDVEGLRNAQIYGDRGQKQEGLDLLALEPDGSGVALQSKRVQQFPPSKLKEAVNTFRQSKPPFAVTRFIIGVSRELNSTQITKEILAQEKALRPIQLEVWDAKLLTDKLRGLPEIVLNFFSDDVARQICRPFSMEPTAVPSPDAVRISEAVARTPEETTGAAEQFRHAREIIDDPDRALRLVEEAQATLRHSDFPGHAAQYEPERTRLLAAVGRQSDASRTILDELWSALDTGRTITAQDALHRLHQLAGGTEDETLSGHLKAAESAMDVYLNPLGELSDLGSVLAGDPRDQARLAVLAGETALANDDTNWLAEHTAQMTPLLDSHTVDIALRTRLRLLLAEATGDWTPLLTDARQRRLGYERQALVTARYARRRALDQHFQEADALWDEASGDASLVQRWEDASTWVYSRRAFRTRWKPFTGDELLTMQRALGELGPAPRIVDLDTSASEDALQNLRTGDLRAAAIAAQRALRDAITTSNWAAETQTRQVLAEILRDADEPERAARHLARAGAVSAIRELGRRYSSRFIDVTAELEVSNYWTVGAAYQLLAEQAELIPDDLVSAIADRIIWELGEAKTGKSIDPRTFKNSRYVGAREALAGIAQRLTLEQAGTVLDHFTAPPRVETNAINYRNEAAAIAGIALAQPVLRQAAIDHLVNLIAQAEIARTSTALRPIRQHLELARCRLEELADEGNTWAREELAAREPATIPAEDATSALQRLTTPLTHEPGVFTVGTNAVRESILARGCAPQELNQAVAELLRRADDPNFGSVDRGEYLVAASNLSESLAEADRNNKFAAAIQCASSPTLSHQDELEQSFHHQFSTIRITSQHDSRPRAVFLAACLVTTDEQRVQVKELAFNLLGAEHDSDYWVAQALQKLGNALSGDVGILAGQGWALRCLAARLWAEHGGSPYVGVKLARDRDIRVRRALARALTSVNPSEAHSAPRTLLEQDPCFSVRAALEGGGDVV